MGLGPLIHITPKKKKILKKGKNGSKRLDQSFSVIM